MPPNNAPYLDVERGKPPLSPTQAVVKDESFSDSDYAEDTYEVGQDVYGLVFASPVNSFAFAFASTVILVKFSLFSFLAVDLYRQNQDGDAFFAPKDSLIRATEFLLLPIAIALQEDLIYVFTRVANIKYNRELMKTNPSATKFKFALSFVLRLMDGLASLTINFVLIMITETVLGIFLNFAALHFLQGIDDIAFQMAHEGFLGDGMESCCRVVEKITMKRRVGDIFTNALDSFLFLLTYGSMLAVWIYVFVFEEKLENEVEL
eukprot:scaffold918_cov126-Cylindrotheca_fusiformis.AAC.51